MDCWRESFRGEECIFKLAEDAFLKRMWVLEEIIDPDEKTASRDNFPTGPFAFLRAWMEGQIVEFGESARSVGPEIRNDRVGEFADGAGGSQVNDPVDFDFWKFFQGAIDDQ